MTKPSNIGLIGLGVMGLPMARNIARAGLPLVVYNRSPEPMLEIAREGVATASSPAEIFDRCETIIVMLHDGAATDSILDRKGDKFGVTVKDRTLINMATMTPAYSEALGKSIVGAGGTYIEAPVSGSRVPAENGELLIIAAGLQSAVDEAAPIFNAIGKKTLFCGPAPHAMAMKSASNMMLVGVVSGIVEGMHFARIAGLDLELLSEVILDGPMASDFTRMKLPRAIAEDYSPQASIKNVAYSLDVMIEAAAAAGVSLPGPEALRALGQEALSMGLKDEDVLALSKVLARKNNASKA